METNNKEEAGKGRSATCRKTATATTKNPDPTPPVLDSSHSEGTVEDSEATTVAAIVEATVEATTHLDTTSSTLRTITTNNHLQLPPHRRPTKKPSRRSSLNRKLRTARAKRRPTARGRFPPTNAHKARSFSSGVSKTGRSKRRQSRAITSEKFSMCPAGIWAQTSCNCNWKRMHCQRKSKKI